MIELLAKGPIKRHDDRRIDKMSGRDSIHGRVSTVETEVVEIDLEFQQGYVNLEGYAPSQPGIGDRDAPLGSVTRVLDLGRKDEILADEWEVNLVGEWFDWIQQAHRYLTERPNKTLVDCLEKFKSWDETDSETLDRSIGEARGATDFSDIVMDKLGDPEWALMREQLNDLDHVQIPDSYSE